MALRYNTIITALGGRPGVAPVLLSRAVFVFKLTI